MGVMYNVSTEKNSKKPEIFFIFLGEKLPAYAEGALTLASQTSGAKLHLLGNQCLEKQLPGVPLTFTPIESFYDQTEFLQASLRVSYPHDFRGGFWLKTLERLFVLEQFMKKTNKKNVFHAELDQLLFNIEPLITNLNSVNKRGIFVPFHNIDNPIASILYCNEVQALSSLLELASVGDVFGNEMELIANWGNIHPSQIFALPSVSDVLGLSSRPEGIQVLGMGEIGGVVDAADIGQWLGGNDPQNVPITETPSNKFANSYSQSELGSKELSNFIFQWNSVQKTLEISASGHHKVLIYNVHLHSKIHNWLAASDDRLETLVMWANKDGKTTIPGTRRRQVTSIARAKFLRFTRSPSLLYYKVRLLTVSAWGYRPSSSPYLSVDSFRSIADHVWESPKFSVSLDAVRQGDVIYCEASGANSLRKSILEKVGCEVVLLLVNPNGIPIPEIDELVSNKNVSQVFAQNLESVVSKVKPLPVGLENRRFGGRGRTKPFKDYLREVQGRNQNQRQMRIMWFFNFNANIQERTEAANALLRSAVADKVEPMSLHMYRDTLKNYGFVACPPGMGVDTHRIWEALYLNCVPVVKRSHMTEAFEEMGVPLLIVNSFRDCIGMTESELRDKYQTLSTKFSSSVLWLPYWRDAIRSSFANDKTH